MIQEKEILRIGSSKPISLEFRVICATNQDLEALVKQGKFKEDLLQRLNVLQIQIPPLRDRVDDIPALLDHFAETLNHGLPKLIFLPETINVIQKYPFTGNVRELSNLVLYLYSMAESNEISPLDLPPKFLATYLSSNSEESKTAGFSGDSEAGSDHQRGRNFYKAVEDFEKKFLDQEYKTLDGNISKMALTLGMDRSYLHSKLKNYGIHGVKK